MGNLDIYEKVRAVPAEAQKPITGGRLKGMTDINPMWRIKVLTEQFGACGVGWYYDVTGQWTVDHGEETAAFVNIALYVKVDGEWSKPISGIGGSMLATKERNGVYVDDECFKKATTDALSVACKSLGIGADVYWSKDSTKYSEKNSSDGEGNSGSPNKQKKKSAERIELEKTMQNEMLRTGYGTKSVMAHYNLNNINDISDLQIKDFLQKMKDVPDREGSVG
jgi:hypothetical protein